MWIVWQLTLIDYKQTETVNNTQSLRLVWYGDQNQVSSSYLSDKRRVDYKTLYFRARKGDIEEWSCKLNSWVVG